MTGQMSPNSDEFELLGENVKSDFNHYSQARNQNVDLREPSQLWRGGGGCGDEGSF